MNKFAAWPTSIRSQTRWVSALGLRVASLGFRAWRLGSSGEEPKRDPQTEEGKASFLGPVIPKWSLMLGDPFLNTKLIRVLEIL